jgi:hypothetical protein
MSGEFFIYLYYFLRELFYKGDDKRKVSPFKRLLSLLLMLVLIFSLTMNTYFIGRIYYLNSRITEFVAAVAEYKKDQKQLETCQSLLEDRTKFLNKCIFKPK